jgi:hypothetical protein
MAHRPEPESIMSRQELAEFEWSVSRLDVSGVEGIYQSAYKECRYDGRELPPAVVRKYSVLRRIKHLERWPLTC